MAVTGLAAVLLFALAPRKETALATSSLGLLSVVSRDPACRFPPALFVVRV